MNWLWVCVSSSGSVICATSCECCWGCTRFSSDVELFATLAENTMSRKGVERSVAMSMREEHALAENPVRCNLNMGFNCGFDFV
jgi:predicted transcriptional regulator